MLELLAATTWFWIFSTGFITSTFLSVLSLFCPVVWWIIPLYAVWIFVDRKTCERGGRPLEWVRTWSWWTYMKRYFKFELVGDGNLKLDPQKNYIFACFPHGILPVGPFASFVDGYEKLFPRHKAFMTALGVQFWVPFIRELFLSVGAVSVSAAAIRYLLRPENGGGNIVSILIGGGDEARYSKRGQYKIILKKRKGFVKMALQTGSPVVPVITFGETDVYDQLTFPGFEIVKNVVKSLTQVSLVLPAGLYGICPYPAKVVTVVGQPINVEKTDNPSPEQIDRIHENFVKALTKLFESHKHKYVKNPEKTFLEIV